MTKLANRQARVTVHDLQVDTANVRIAFKVELSVKSSCNTASAEITNLAESSRARIQVKKPQFIIEAGYEGALGTLFKGEAAYIEHEKSATDFTTKVLAADGFTAQRQIVNVSLGAGATVAQAIEAICKASKLDATKVLKDARSGAFDGDLGTFLFGFTVSGTVQEALDRLTQTLGVDWSIQNEELQFILPGKTTLEEAVVLGADSGLIGSPKHVHSKKKQSQVYVQARSLLQAKLRPGRRVLLESKTISGSFRVSKATHTGDTRGADWFSDIEVVSL